MVYVNCPQRPTKAIRSRKKTLAQADREIKRQKKREHLQRKAASAVSPADEAG
jgi:hypothetical protein